MNVHLLTEFFSGVVALSWRAGWLIVALAALRLAVRGRVPAQVWFGAWILVALRLLVPFSVPAGWSPYNWSPALSTATAPRAVAVAVTRNPPPPVTPAVVSTAQPAPVIAPAAAPIIAPPMRADSRWTLMDWAAALWLAGVAGVLVARLAGAGSFRRGLRDARPVADARVAACLTQERVGNRIVALETDTVDAPALFGLVRPRLLLPPGLAAKLTDAELRHVVRHELGHWRRRDLLAQTVMQAAVAVHWFNPLAWLAARLARADCELACDEFVLRRESPAGASAYGATLLKVLGVIRGRRRPVAVVAMLEGREQLTQRIRLIADYRASTVGRVLAGVALLGVIAAASLTRESLAENLAASPAYPPGTSSPNVAAPPPIKEYELRPGDVIRVLVVGMSENYEPREVRLTPDGTVELPPIGGVTLRDKTVRQARELLGRLYTQHGGIGEPRVSIQIVEYARSVVARADALSSESEIKAIAVPSTRAPSQLDLVPKNPGTLYVGQTTISAGSLPPRVAGETTPTVQSEQKDRTDRMAGVYDRLKPVVEEQRQKVERLARELEDYKARNNLGSLDRRQALLDDTLKSTNLALARTTQSLYTAESRLAQIRECRAKNLDLTTLPFIGTQPVITQLTTRQAEQRIVIEGLNRRYDSRHPRMIEARDTLTQIERELQKAIDTACTQVESDYQATLRSNERYDQDLDRAKLEWLDLDRRAQELARLERELKTNELLLQSIVARAFAPKDPSTESVTVPRESNPAARGVVISVMGAVGQQGAISFGTEEKPILLDVIARAGGFAPRADRNAVRVIRQNPDGSRSTTTLSEKELMSGADPIGVLQRGDIVFVPELAEPAARGQVSALGAVNSPGTFTLYDGKKLTLVECLARAGGATRLGDLKKVRITRLDPETKGTKVLVVDVDGFLRGGAADANLVLEPGDIVFVPERMI